MTGIRRASLLVVLAHPDDEIFHGGILAHFAERGARVTLVCATDGEAGKPHPIAPMLRAFRPVFEREAFVLGGARSEIRQWPLVDFFDGLQTTDTFNDGS